jgi:putative FmdB family regulatory protein
MPLYVYRCKEGHEVEEMRTIADRARPRYCARCLSTRNETVQMTLQPSMTAPNFPGAGSWRG